MPSVTTKIKRNLYRLFAFTITLVFATFSVGCTQRVLVHLHPDSLEKERILFVTLTSNKELKVREPRFVDGFLLGKVPKYGSLSGPHEESRIPLSQIKSIKVERFSAKKSIFALSVVALTFGALYLYASQYKDGFN
ncbi:hypothetical protein MJD09_12300 [bacterium]|nr:hypothetical protein [bacterium]